MSVLPLPFSQDKYNNNGLRIFADTMGMRGLLAQCLSQETLRTAKQQWCCTEALSVCLCGWSLLFEGIKISGFRV